MEIVLGSEDVNALVVQELKKRLGPTNFSKERLMIQVRSKQNYKEHEWESGEILVTYDHLLTVEEPDAKKDN